MTTSSVVAVRSPTDAVIVLVPGPTALATPGAATVATAGSLEVQVAVVGEVRGSALPNRCPYQRVAGRRQHRRSGWRVVTAVESSVGMISFASNVTLVEPRRIDGRPGESVQRVVTDGQAVHTARNNPVQAARLGSAVDGTVHVHPVDRDVVGGHRDDSAARIGADHGRRARVGAGRLRTVIPDESRVRGSRCSGSRRLIRGDLNGHGSGCTRKVHCLLDARRVAQNIHLGRRAADPARI